MALRYTQTEKWGDGWYLSLTNDQKAIWQCIIDKCSISGIWKEELGGVNFLCRTEMSQKEFESVFGDKIIKIEIQGYRFIPTFLSVQYPNGIKSNKPLMISVRKELEKFNLIPLIKKTLDSRYHIEKES